MSKYVTLRYKISHKACNFLLLPLYFLIQNVKRNKFIEELDIFKKMNIAQFDEHNTVFL